MRKGIFSFILVLFSFSLTHAQLGDNSFSEESKLYTKIADVEITTGEGRYKLSEIYSRSPVVIAYIFTRCVGVCNPFLLRLSENVRILDSRNKFKVLVLSFDPADDLADLERFAQRFGLEDDNQWIFATTDQIQEMNESVGFEPVWDSARMQFDHEALLVGINENGYITRKLAGLRDAAALSNVVKEINNEFVLSYPLPNENMLFSCFSYDPVTGKKKFSVGMLVLLLPATITLLFIFWLATKKPETDSSISHP